MRLFQILLTAVLLSTGPGARADEGDPVKVKIVAIEGAGTVLLQHGITLTEGSLGDQVPIGHRIRTDEKTTVTLEYPDGTKLMVMPKSDYEIELPRGGIVLNRLRNGQVEGIVAKAPEVASAAGALPAPTPTQAAPRPIKFMIRTKTAVMGVRGTEFVAAFDAAQGVADFHTVEGTVEVASNPAKLLGGASVPIGSGHSIQATAAGGLGAVQSFNVASYVGGLGGLLGSSSSSSKSAAAASTPATSSAVSAVADATPAAAAPVDRAPPSAPAPAPPPKIPEIPPTPLPPPIEQAKAEEARKEEDRPKIHLLSFAFGAFYSPNPNPSDETNVPWDDAFFVTWTPTIPIPLLSFLYVRGSFGLTFFEGFSVNNAFLISNYEVFAGTTILPLIYAEVGGGEQIWRNDDIDATILSANVGLILSPNGRFNRIFVGGSKFFQGTQPLEARVGIGIQLF